MEERMVCGERQIKNGVCVRMRVCVCGYVEKREREKGDKVLSKLANYCGESKCHSTLTHTHTHAHTRTHIHANTRTHAFNILAKVRFHRGSDGVFSPSVTSFLPNRRRRIKISRLASPLNKPSPNHRRHKRILISNGTRTIRICLSGKILAALTMGNN